MNFSYNWEDVRPRRQRPDAYGTCWWDGAGAWGGTGRTRDTITPGPCGTRSYDWHSNNNRNGNGNAVVKIQQLLNSYMVDMRRRGVSGVPANLVTDGIYGSKTRAAVHWYQGRVGLKADGLAGHNTWQKLRYA